MYFVDLFAGCGGLSLGLEQAGFHPVLVNELNHQAMETYLLNRERQYPYLRSEFHTYDIKDMVSDNGAKLSAISMRFRDVFGLNVPGGSLDLLVGGPPCQGYSGIGHRRSYSVDKAQLPSNHLYQDMAFVIHRLQPKAFLFENVKGLLSAKWTASGTKGEIWKDVYETFAGIPNYTVAYALVHAKEYGVPQNRPRVLLVGFRDDLGIGEQDGKRANGFLPEPIGSVPDLEVVLGDLIDPDYLPGGETKTYPHEALNDVQKEYRFDPETSKVRAKGECLTDQAYSKHSALVIEKFQYMIENGGQIPDRFQTKKFAQRVLPRRWGEGGPSITATSLPDDYVHYSQPRILTVREWARLQTFPDWYEFAGKRTTGGLRRAGNPLEGLHEREVPKYTQIGNAVPVAMARAVGLHLASLLCGEGTEQPQPTQIDRPIVL